jgi:multiple sugar transport system permease protein
MVSASSMAPRFRIGPPDGASVSGRHSVRHMFVLPGVALVLALAIFPLVMSIGLSFVYWDIANPVQGIRWAGLNHWSRLFSDSHFHTVLGNTLLYVFVGIPVQFGLGLALARAIDRQRRQGNVLRVLFLVPMMLSPVVVAFVVGRVLFNETVGPINMGLAAIGISPVPWLTSRTMAFATVLIVDTWQWTPFFMLIMLAGLSSLPVEVEEAARLDTASDFQAFWRVTFPMLLPWAVTAIVIRSIEMLKIVDVIVVITNGGPGVATESLTLYAYRTGIVNFDLGYAAVLAFSLLLVAIALASLIILPTRPLIARLA